MYISYFITTTMGKRGLKLLPYISLAFPHLLFRNIPVKKDRCLNQMTDGKTKV